MKTFYDIASDRWPMRRISGAGQFAVVPMDSQTIVLCMTRGEAENMIIDRMRVMVCDLQERSLPDFDRIPDLEDREERKARRREDRQRVDMVSPAAQQRQRQSTAEQNVT